MIPRFPAGGGEGREALGQGFYAFAALFAEITLAFDCKTRRQSAAHSATPIASICKHARETDNLQWLSRSSIRRLRRRVLCHRLLHEARTCRKITHTELR